MMFEVGQMVLCISGFEESRAKGDSRIPYWPCNGHLYTIRGFWHDAYEPSNPGLWLEEIVNPIEKWRNVGRVEASFSSRGFRPVRKTDISELRKLVAPVPRQPVPAE